MLFLVPPHFYWALGPEGEILVFMWPFGPLLRASLLFQKQVVVITVPIPVLSLVVFLTVIQ